MTLALLRRGCSFIPPRAPALKRFPTLDKSTRCSFRCPTKILIQRRDRALGAQRNEEDKLDPLMEMMKRLEPAG